MEAEQTFLILAWMIGLIWCLRNAKLLAAGAATMGVFAAFVPSLPEWILLTAIMIFAISLWLEAVLMDRVYAQFFNPASRRRTREP